jgi:hypothetical protein
MLGYMMRYHPAVRALAAADLSDVFQFALTIGHDVTQWRAELAVFRQLRGAGGRRRRAAGPLPRAGPGACLFPSLEVTAVESLGHVGLSRRGFRQPDFAEPLKAWPAMCRWTT